ncbi:DEAD/DEAH box helicase [Candidatus Micrarchaeota archaeon]|nr:DEAD/DEAH box helicase [Candidatus Micrarchaeota archaeon]
MSFQELKISQPLLRSLAEMGFQHPTPIQKEAIPVALQGKDLVGQAKTGTGKTAAFGIPILDRLSQEHPALQAIILVPTRELAVQVAKEIREIGKYAEARVLAVYGGEDIERQIRELRHGTQIMVGTPGRVIDHLKRGTLNLSQVRTVVLDEADRMLDMGFIDDVKYILSKTPREKQTMLFSATMPGPIIHIAEHDMRSPVTLRVSEDKMTVETVKQYYWGVDGRDKPDALATILKHAPKPLLALIFCRTKFGADRVERILGERGFKAMALHGNLTQARRDHVMAQFRSGAIDALVATDIAARGLDVPDVTHVINYDPPNEPTTYVHRIGRTARAGKEGEAISFVSNVAEIKQLRMTARMANAEIEQYPITKVDHFPHHALPQRPATEQTHIQHGGRPQHGRPHGRMGGGPMHGPSRPGGFRPRFGERRGPPSGRPRFR